MITMTSIQERVIMCVVLVSLTAGRLAAIDHPITLTTTNGVVNGFKQNLNDGDSGNVKAANGETVTWKCDSPCGTIFVHFDDPSPCSGGAHLIQSDSTGTATCLVTDTSPLLAHKYEITVGSFDKDPHVIVDNQTGLPGQKKRPGH
jgi:hypothetical protein